MLLRMRKKVVVAVLLHIIGSITELPWRGGGKPRKASARIFVVLTDSNRVHSE